MMQKLAGEVLDRCLAALGEAVEYLPADGPSASISGVFDGPHQDVDPQTGAVVSSVQYSVGIRLSDLSAEPAQNDHLIVRGREYVVIDVRPDGQGGASLRLHER